VKIIYIGEMLIIASILIFIFGFGFEILGILLVTIGVLLVLGGLIYKYGSKNLYKNA